jgi:hypothetical protein
MQSIEKLQLQWFLILIFRVLRVLLVLPHVLFLAHFEEAPSMKDHTRLMYPRSV